MAVGPRRGVRLRGYSSGDHVPIFPPIDAVTNDAFAYMRCHGRNTEGYLHGRSVAERFDYDYSGQELEEIAGRAPRSTRMPTRST